MQKLGDFKLPHFFNYPPYFTLQPVRDTREKQVQLWKELILDYCRTQKIFVIGLEEEFPLFSNPVIENALQMRLTIGVQEDSVIGLRFGLKGTLSHEAREAFLSALVSEGRAEWLDKGHRKCLILWHRIQEWADIILNFVKDNGLEDSVMTVEEIRSGTESRGTGDGWVIGPCFWLELGIVLRTYHGEVLILCFKYSASGNGDSGEELSGIDRTILMRALKLLEQKGKLAIFKGTSADDEGVKFSI
ncbi:hypothetical protein FEM48_Zijuj11G0134700 [Ziziphus jujuba var. spinosa]|uniref:Vacuolar protein sorting-associated protein 25 n=1 Tax=Ziziphus jujuba var. spinosa TaxID=714518 RepID=A0A978UJ73_ZIZJJ|nr:hypothetical protein FEM48_Zijuj11G0134700 [Ziziphus jujuba var. spinosa]